jgi:hypothetical protein
VFELRAALSSFNSRRKRPICVSTSNIRASICCTEPMFEIEMKWLVGAAEEGRDARRRGQKRATRSRRRSARHPVTRPRDVRARLLYPDRHDITTSTLLASSHALGKQ